MSASLATLSKGLSRKQGALLRTVIARPGLGADALRQALGCDPGHSTLAGIVHRTNLNLGKAGWCIRGGSGHGYILQRTAKPKKVEPAPPPPKSHDRAVPAEELLTADLDETGARAFHRARTAGATLLGARLDGLAAMRRAGRAA